MPTLVAHMPGLSQAARSHSCEKPKNAPAIQHVALLLLLLLEYMPTRKTDGSHTNTQDIVVTKSECWTGAWTCVRVARMQNSSGASSL